MYGGGASVFFALSDRLSLEAISLVEGSSNSVDIGGDTGDFGARRLALGARMSGTIPFGHWSIAPGVSVEFQDTQREGYVDSAGDAVPGSHSKFGRLTFGPELQRSIALFREEGIATVHPFVRVQGVWDFLKEDTLASPSLYGDDVFARFAGGVRWFGAEGAALAFAAEYTLAGEADGLGLSGEFSVPVSFGDGPDSRLKLNATGDAQGNGYGGMQLSIPLK